MKLRTTILRTGATTTGIEVPAEMVAALGQGKKPPVRVTLNGYTYRTTIASVGGRHMISVSADTRAKAGVSGGDELEVDIEIDAEKRDVVVPLDLRAALDVAPECARAFDALAFSHKQRHVLSVDEARTAETRQRRVAKVIDALRAPPK